MREASVLPGSGGRRWGCLKIPTLPVCPSAAACGSASPTPSCSLPPPPGAAARPPARQTGAGFHLSISSLLGPVHHASVGPGCQGQGRSLVFSSDRLLLGAREEWTEHTPSVPAPTPSRFCFTKLTVARSSPGPTSARSARSLFPLVLLWIAKVGRGACVGWAELGAGGPRRKIRERHGTENQE